jgi:hypothetical protein
MAAFRFALSASIAGIAWLAESAACAQTYNAFSQFRLSENPNQTWSYVAAGNLLTTKIKVCNGIIKDYCRTNGQTNFPNIAAFEANKTGTTINYLDVTLPARYLDLDPTGIANVGTQWTAPGPGMVRVHGNFMGVAHDEGSHTVSVQHNGVALQTFTISSYQQVENFDDLVSVNTGDSISFLSFTGNNGNSLSTGLQAEIVYK